MVSHLAQPETARGATAPDIDPEVIDTTLVAQAHVLHSRAESLRNQSLTVDEVLAKTFRRRAAELELEAWASEVRAGLPESQLHMYAA